MKGFLYDPARSYATTEVPTLEPDPGDVRVEVDQFRVCGTDLHIHQARSTRVFALVITHRVPLERDGRVLEALSADPTVHRVGMTARPPRAALAIVKNES